MAASITDLLTRASNGTRPVPTTLNAIKAIAAASISCAALTGWPTATAVHFIIYTIDTSGKKVAGSQTDWKGVVSGTSITALVLKAGTDNGYGIGAIVECAPTAAYADDLYANVIAHANQDGSLRTAAVQAALNLSAAGTDGWTALATPPNSPTYNGQRSYQVVFPGVDYTDRLSLGTRLKLPRTVAAPTQCTLLNGTTQYFSKSAPAGMTFTNNFVVSAWIKLTSYPSAGQMIVSRYNGTSGWALFIDGAGRLVLRGTNGGSSNVADLTAYNSVPLGRWVHVTAQLDMTSTTNSATVNYVMFDGVDTPAQLIRGGTSPTALIQAGNLEVGSWNGGLAPLAGKVAQVAIFNTKITQATIRTYIGQTMSGSETALVSAYTFNNTLNDLSANANNLTANGAAVATNADSPFAQANSTGVNEYGLVMAISFSTDTTVTVQVPEGSMLPTSGGVGACSFSTSRIPYGFPGSKNKWRVFVKQAMMESIGIGGINAWWGANSGQLSIPVGEWLAGFEGCMQFSSSVNGVRSGWIILTSDVAPTGITSGIIPPAYDIIARLYVQSSVTDVLVTPHPSGIVSVAALAVFKLWGAIDVATGSESWLARGSQGPIIVYADNAYL